MKTTRPFFYGFVSAAAVAMAGCHEQDVTPPVPQLRAETMTTYLAKNEGLHHRTLQYDANGTITGILSKVIYHNGSEYETNYEFSYENGRLTSIHGEDIIDWTTEYIYLPGNKIGETRLYTGDELLETHVYTYNTDGLLTTEITLIDSESEEPGGRMIPVYKQEFAYDTDKNLIRQVNNGHDGTDYVLISTIEYDDFDDKTNPDFDFLNNLLHPAARTFTNNPRTMRIINSVGTVFEKTFSYEYNAQNIATKKITDGVGTSVEYKFKEIK